MNQCITPRYVLGVLLALQVFAASATTVNADGLYVTSSGKVGIGTSSPGNYKLQVIGGAAVTGLDVNPGNASAGITLQSTTSSQWDQSIDFKDPNGDWYIGQRWQTTSNNFGIGTTSDKDNLVMTSSGLVGINKVPGTGYTLDVGGSYMRLGGSVADVGLVLETTGTNLNYDQSISFVDNNGSNRWVVGQRYQSPGTDFGIGTDGGKNSLVLDTSSNMYLGGKIYLGNYASVSNTNWLCVNTSTGAIGTCTSSSMRLKNDIHSFDGGLDTIKKLRPVSFKWKDSGKNGLGFVAEEVDKVDKRLSVIGPDGEVEGVQYQDIPVYLTRAVQQQQAQIEALEKQVASLVKELSSLKQPRRAEPRSTR
jgi:hypothetical protein